MNWVAGFSLASLQKAFLRVKACKLQAFLLMKLSLPGWKENLD
jgi:hypothetical protein